MSEQAAIGDGTFSDNGTTYTPPTGPAQTGITDPVTGQFLANGEVRTIDGAQVYGSVQDGTFYSEDGKLIVTAAGVVEHGYTDDQNQFHSQRVVGGVVMYGFDTDKGGWISDDGTTYVDSKGNSETGISTPDGDFIANGTTHTLPDGTVLYGVFTAGDFYSSDGKWIVLADGTAIQGTTDTATGIFTAATGGSIYVITDNGILYGTVDEVDGSLLLSDGSVYMTPKAWGIDVPAFKAAIDLVGTKASSISDQIDTITRQYTVIEPLWSSPSGETFKDVAANASTAMKNLQDLLNDIIDRMKKSYINYVAAEKAALENVTQNQ